jgi:hypothetical protein
MRALSFLSCAPIYGRNFLFQGCRFARQTMKRFSDKHGAVLPEEPTRNKKCFQAE